MCAHAAQPAGVRSDARPQRAVLVVADAEFPAGLLHQRRQVRVVEVADAREQMVLDAEVVVQVPFDGQQPAQASDAGVPPAILIPVMCRPKLWCGYAALTCADTF